MRLRTYGVFLGMALAGASFGDAANELKTSVEGAFAKMTAAFRTHDATAYRKFADGYEAKSFVQIDAQGVKQSRENQIQLDLAHMAMLNQISVMAIKVSNVKVIGDSGRTIEEFNLTSTAMVPKDMKEPGAGMKVGKLRVWSIQRSVYRKVKGKWMVILSTTTGQKVWVDGKLVPN